jgi:hypothetical protein
VIRNFPKNDGWVARCNALQILYLLVAASTNFPKKTRYRESLSLTVALTVGFGSVAAANPIWERLEALVREPVQRLIQALLEEEITALLAQ